MVSGGNVLYANKLGFNGSCPGVMTHDCSYLTFTNNNEGQL